MGEQAVEFLLNNLKELVEYHFHLIRGAKQQVDNLESDLQLLKASLIEATKKPIKDERIRVLLRQIREVVHEAEDIIDNYVTRVVESKHRPNCFRSAFQKPAKLLTIGNDVEAVSGKIKRIFGDRSRAEMALLSFGDEEPENLEDAVIRLENVVGFDDDAETLIKYLMQETQQKTEQLDVISVIGMPGQGKTTLARKIFLDPKIQNKFDKRIWVCVSQLTKKGAFLSILGKLIPLNEDIKGKDAQELAELVAAELQTKKFLIVMDDVWTAEDWDIIQNALPKTNAMGKVLITSRNEEVGRCVRKTHKLRRFNQKESWSLLQSEVFGESTCPSELEPFGQLIAEQCDGLPLALVVLGGILKRMLSATNAMSTRRHEWRKVSESMSAYLSEDPSRLTEKRISSSYNALPYHLRACFLYLGMFPKDVDILASRLIRMWIAEGFIPEKKGKSLEETAEMYLVDLINRNLVRIKKIKPNDKVKTLSIHYMTRYFCETEAGKEREDFYQEIKKSSHGDFQPSLSDLKSYRRLCIHSNVFNFITSKPRGPRVRSFVCFSNEDTTLPLDSISAIPAAFKLVRVLDVKPIKFASIPNDMYQLIHLRYIVLSFNLDILPAAFSKLWNLQTLIIDTTSPTIDIKADIWNMIRLRHLKTNASANLPKSTRSSKQGEQNLQTLGRISPESCTEGVSDRAQYLKKLGIRGRLASLLDGKNGSFDCVGKLINLEKLKLLNDTSPIPPSEDPLPGLPPPYKFPLKLRSLTLSATFLKWEQMSTLGLLVNLEVLKLKNKAFVGQVWESANEQFTSLEALHIGSTDLVIWKASGDHFPRLRCLQLRNCESLKEVPIGLADIQSLQQLDLYSCTSDAAASAKRIDEAKREKHPFPTTATVGVLKLSISS